MSGAKINLRAAHCFPGVDLSTITKCVIIGALFGIAIVAVSAVILALAFGAMGYAGFYLGQVFVYFSGLPAAGIGAISGGIVGYLRNHRERVVMELKAESEVPKDMRENAFYDQHRFH